MQKQSLSLLLSIFTKWQYTEKYRPTKCSKFSWVPNDYLQCFYLQNDSSNLWDQLNKILLEVISIYVQCHVRNSTIARNWSFKKKHDFQHGLGTFLNVTDNNISEDPWEFTNKSVSLSTTESLSEFSMMLLAGKF